MGSLGSMMITKVLDQLDYKLIGSSLNHDPIIFKPGPQIL